MKIINFIRGGNKALRHRLFVDFLRDFDTTFSYLPLYTAIRWFRAGKCLERFFSLHREVLDFSCEMKENNPKHIARCKVFERTSLSCRCLEFVN